MEYHSWAGGAPTPRCGALRWGAMNSNGLLRSRVLMGLALVASAGAIAYASLHTTPAASASAGTITVVDIGGGYESSIAVGPTGNPVVAYRGRAPALNPDALGVLTCGNPGCTSGNTIAMPDATSDATGVSLTLDSLEVPVISYVDDGLASDILKVLRCGNSACTTVNVITVVAGGLNSYSDTTILLDALGNPIVGYRQNSGAGAGLKVLHCGNPTCTAGNVTSTVAGTGSSPSLALDASGNPVMSYAAFEGLRLARCVDPACTTPATIQTIDGTVGVDQSSIQIDGAGNPVIAYNDTTNGDLRIAHCSNADCSAGTSIVTADSAGVTGLMPSMRLRPSGLPAVAYYDASQADLRILSCADALCAGGNVTSSPDTLDHVGQNPSLALDMSGNPVISYHDRSNLTLRVLRCSDQTCGGIKATPTPRPRPQFSMAIDTNGTGGDDCGTAPSQSTTCVLPPGSTFQLKFYLDSLGDAAAFGGYDIYVEFADVTPLHLVDQTAWPECVYAASVVEAGYLAMGCAIGQLMPGSSYTGLVATATFYCGSIGTFDMVHGYGKGSTALHETFFSPLSEGELATESLTVQCTGVPATPTQTPTPAAVGGLSMDPPERPAASHRQGARTAGLIAAGLAAAVAAGAYRLRRSPQARR